MLSHNTLYILNNRYTQMSYSDDSYLFASHLNLFDFL